MKDVVIVGAGVGGLTLAYRLEKLGVDVLVLEASSQIGGMVSTVHDSGFLLECGPNSCALRPPLAALIQELGISSELVPPNVVSKSRFIAHPKRERTRFSPEDLKLVRVPLSPGGFLRSPIMSAAGKLRLLAEPAIRTKSDNDLSVQQLFERHFGREFTQEIVAPLLGGIWAADIGTLSARSALPSIWQTTSAKRSLVLEGLKRLKERQKSAPVAGASFSTFKQGMRTLPHALADRLKPDTVALDVAVTGVELTPSEVQILTSKGAVLARSVVLTTDAAATASLVKAIAPGLAQRIERIPYAPIGIVHLAYRKESLRHDLNGFGFLVPPRLRSVTLGAIFSSSVFPGRAPSDYHLITCFIGGAKNPQNADPRKPEIREQLLEELRHLLGATDPPLILRESYWRHSIPNYPVGHYKIQQEIDAFQQSYPRLRILANWDRGIGIPDRIEQAEQLAKSLVTRPELETSSKKIANI